jgi:glycosyltransferase involved in cell wall biosynthesis
LFIALRLIGLRLFIKYLYVIDQIMSFIHLTARRFQFLTADSVYVSNLAEQFNRILGKDYLLVVGNKSVEQFSGINVLNLNLKVLGRSVWLYFWPPYVYCFFWLPYFLIFKRKLTQEDTVFSSDNNLLSLLIFWKKILRLKFKICSDWHMLFNNWKDNYVAKNSDYLIATSIKLKKLLLGQKGVKEENILTVYGGVNLDEFKPRDQVKLKQELGLPLAAKLIGYIGLFKTMGMEKGIKTMIESLNFLDDQVRMVFVGGKEEEILGYQTLAKNLKLSEKCVFVGRQPYEKMALYEQAMDVLVIPYPDLPHFRLYGFPMKVYEYMAAKKPIVYSKLDLTEEVLTDSGFTFKPDNPDDLAKTLNYVLAEGNRLEVEKKISLAFSKVFDYTWAKKAERIINFLKK